MSNKVKEQQKRETGIRPALPQKYDVYISFAIITGAILLLGLSMLSIGWL